jgi:catechol 2,3-dioxygenase-like lactoylglutathione lyase family enzyme
MKLGYTTIGVRDMDAAKKFYSDLLDAKVLFDGGRIAFIGESMGDPMVAVCVPYDENDPQPGNGVMLAFRAGSQEACHTLHEKALKLGATCEGEPGSRIPGTFYGSYVRDPDGNKLCFFDFS